MLTNKNWWKAALIRAVRTIAQTAVGMVAVGAAVQEVDWLRVLSVSAVAGLLSILTSLGGLPEVDVQSQTEVKVVYLDEDGREIETDSEGRILVYAYEDYDENGDPIPNKKG